MGCEGRGRFPRCQRAQPATQQAALECGFLSRPADCGEIPQSLPGGSWQECSENARFVAPVESRDSNRTALVILPFDIQSARKLCHPDALSGEFRHQSRRAAWDGTLPSIPQGGAPGFGLPLTQGWENWYRLLS